MTPQEQKNRLKTAKTVKNGWSRRKNSRKNWSNGAM